MSDNAYDKLSGCGKVVFMLVFAVLLFPVGTIFILCFYACYDGEPNIREQLKKLEGAPDCTPTKNSNQLWFACQAITACCFKWYPMKRHFIEKLTLAKAIRRYTEAFGKERKIEYLKGIQENPFLVFILRKINECKSHFFFKILPAGSVRESFGKPLPSTSILASDYDLMLVPDAIHVQPTDIIPQQQQQQQYPQQQHQHQQQQQGNSVLEHANFLTPQLSQIGSEQVYFHNEPPVFDALIDRTKMEKTMPEGYLWLKLNNINLTQWKKLCIPRQHNKKTEYFLSQLAVYREIRDGIGNVKQNRRFLEDITDTKYEDIDIYVEHNGPAVTVTIDTNEYQNANWKIISKLGMKLICVIIVIYLPLEIAYLISPGFAIALACVIFIPGCIFVLWYWAKLNCYVYFPCFREYMKFNHKNYNEKTKKLTKRTKWFECDFTLALHCPEFPEEAKKEFFENRKEAGSKKVWPMPNVVENIKAIGCHVVPKPSTKTLIFYSEEQQKNSYLSQSAVLEWRFSFSQPEMLLADVMPEIPRTVYLAFKATIKRHVNAECGRMYNKIPSYVLKSILLRKVERYSVEHWETGDKDKMTVEFFKKVFENLLKKIKRRKIMLFDAGSEIKVSCPHYWIPGIDLMAGLNFDDVDFIEQRLETIKKRNYTCYVADGWLETERFVREKCSNVPSCKRKESGLVITNQGKYEQKTFCGYPMYEEHIYVY